ncbi:MAG TPA: cobaltochelatase subunit CobN [Candidatus Dormibacteraeota bacterium]|nr:cobaltochelatase subunit CobN [Candidatus Dormibacteraeota bacterium]
MIVLVTTADTELIALAAARRRRPAGCAEVAGMSCIGWTAAEVRARLEPLLPRARCVAVRLLGGRRALPEAVDAIAAACAAHGVALVAWPGDLTPDPELSALTTLDAEVAGRGFAYLVHGGDANVAQLVRLLSDATCGTSVGCDPPRPVPWDGRYHPDAPEDPGAAEGWWRARLDPGDARPVVGLVFYRAHWMTGNLALVDALCAALEARGCRTLPVFCYSLRTDGGDPAAFAHLRDETGRPLVDVLVSTLSFAMGELPVSGPQVAAEWSAAALVRLGVPVVQAIAATASREQWQRSDAGLSPVDVVMNVALPEFDGRIVSVPVSFKERVDGVTRYVPDPERVGRCAGLCARLARLRRLPRAEVRLAVVLSSYPTRNSRVGNAVGLDTPASAVRLLGALRAQGYDLGDGPLPGGGDALMHDLLAAGGYDREYLTAEQLAAAPGHLGAAEYARWFEALPASSGAAVRRSWGEPPGRLYSADGRLAFPGLRMGNVLVCIQPPRGFGEDPTAIYHSPDLPPSHHYLGFHRWLDDGFGADAVVHLGKHGTMEWLPGKALGLSAACFPDLCIADLPLFYPFVVNDPGEGTQAKRRAHAVVIDHLIPPVSTADAYGPIVAVEQLMDEYFQSQALDPERLPLIQERIWEEVRQAHLDADLAQPSRPDDFDAFLLRMDGYLCELKDAQIRNGLHVLGVPPDGEALIDMMLACARPTDGGVPGLEDQLAAACGLDLDALLADRGAAAGACPAALLPYLTGTLRVAGDLVEAVRGLARELVVQLAAADFDAVAIPALLAATVPSEGAAAALEHLATVLWPALRHTSDEIGNLLLGLHGGHVPAGPSGAPTRGMTHVLPTGRNFYSVDPKSLPTETSWRVGRRLAGAVVERHAAETGAPPRTVGIVVWGTSAMRTGGDDISQALALLGVRPLWNRENRRVRGLETITIEELGRPRVDVVLRVSGFFRDAFPNLVHLFDEAVELVSGLDEDAAANPIAARVRDESAALVAAGLDPTTAAERARYRIFGSRPGAYGAGVLPLLDAGNWQTDADIAAVYTAWGAHAYTRERYGVAAEEQFRSSFSRIAVAIKNQDNREHDIFDSDDYLQYHGGMIACVRALTGTAPRAYFGDSADPARARVRDLAEEARRVFRARVVNPKWLAAMRRHGYKGAFEMAATVDYLYGYDATAGIVDGWMYAQVADDYVLDAVSQEFVRRSNPWALKAMAERLLEAAARGLWDGADEERLRALRAVATEVDAELEAQMAPAAGRRP